MLKILQLAFKSAGIFLFLYASPTFAELNLLKQLGTALDNVQIELNKIELQEVNWDDLNDRQRDELIQKKRAENVRPFAG